MKTLQITFACLILLVGQVALGYAADVEGLVIPRPDGGNTNWGHSVDVSGTTLIAGYTSYVGNAGGIFIMEQKGKRWETINHFKTPDNGTRDQYGHAVAIEGDIAIVSAYEHGGKKPVAGGSLGGGPGLVYVLQRVGGKGFGEMAKLKGEGIQNDDRFGYSVDISRDILIAGTPFHDTEKGAVYVYQLDGKQWKQQAKLQADDAAEKNRFGWDCAVHENTIVVGAPLAAAPKRLSGAAYVFKRQGDAWAQVAKITPEDGDGGDNFGASVDVSKSRIVVGASKDENEVKKRGSGSAYVFQLVGNEITQEAKLTADDPQEGATFGLTVAIDVNRVLVGAPSTDTKRGDDSGAVYAFLKVGADWVLQARVIPEKGGDEGKGLTSGDNMGSAVALDGEFGRKVNFAALGVQWDGDGDHGSVYIFDTEDVQGLNIPLSVEPRGDLALTMLGDIKRTALLQNFPNPFNPETWIPYTLADNADVKVRIYDVEGKLVRNLDIGYQRSGRYISREKAVYWDGRDQLGEFVSSGVYFYTLKTDGFSDTRRMVILK